MKTPREIVLSLPIDCPQLGLSARCMNSLRNAFARQWDRVKHPDVPDNQLWLVGRTFLMTPTLADILEHSDDKLMMVKNMGVHSVAEISALRAMLFDGLDQ